jgi:hypothetical protein
VEETAVDFAQGLAELPPGSAVFVAERAGHPRLRLRSAEDISLMRKRSQHSLPDFSGGSHTPTPRPAAESSKRLCESTGLTGNGCPLDKQCVPPRMLPSVCPCLKLGPLPGRTGGLLGQQPRSRPLDRARGSTSSEAPGDPDLRRF